MMEVHQNQGVLGTFDSGCVCKVKLPISYREGTSSLVGGESGLRYLELGSELTDLQKAVRDFKKHKSSVAGCRWVLTR